jgi:DNA-binding NtrC family response regulator
MEAEVAARRLRPDLFFRLMGVMILVPALRARPEDIAVLVEHFTKELGSPVPLAPGTLAAMQCDAWPGNVRELRNGVERVLRFGAAPGEGAGAAPEPGDQSYSAARQKVLDAFERDFLAGLLARHKGKISPAANAAGISRSQFYRMLERHGLK